VKRLCDFLGCGAEGVVDKIGWRPFEDPENLKVFDVELGLKLPCGFRRDGRCSVYPARPLNCRMFPSVFLGNVPDDQLHEVIDATHKCIVEGISLTADEKSTYRESAHKIGEQILAEASVTEEWYVEHGLKRQVKVESDEEYGLDVMQGREETKKRVQAAMEKIGNDNVDEAVLKKGISDIDCQEVS
jgi:Fe-S-cluster containining protein